MLETEFRCAGGVLRVRDFLPIRRGRGNESSRSTEAIVRSVLCIEGDPRDHDRLALEARAAVAPWPVDDVVVLRGIPRDPRHASKTDLESLRAVLKRRG